MWAILATSFFLVLFSFANLFGIRPQLFSSEAAYFIAALVAFFIFRKIGWRMIRDNAKPIYWIFIFLLVFTYLLGLEVKGSRRWIDLYFFNFQPSEFFKIFFVFFLADFFTRHRKDIEDTNVFLRSLLYVGLPALIIFKQPDLGNAAVFVFIYLIMLFFSNIPKKTILKTFLIFTALLPLGWFVLKDYQRLRLTTFLNLHTDQSGASYNMVQAMITVGSGKFFGRGLAQGTQSKLYFLPENHTDFAFSSLVEQFGFFGGICVLFFFFFLTVLLINRLRTHLFQRDEESFYKFLVILGFLSYFIFQVFVNIGMNLGVFPVAGIALPFISYGGSALVAFFIGLALLP